MEEGIRHKAIGIRDKEGRSQETEGRANRWVACFCEA